MRISLRDDMPLRWPSCGNYSAPSPLPSKQPVAGSNPAGRAERSSRFGWVYIHVSGDASVPAFPRPMIIASAGFGAAILACAFSPFLGLAYAALLFVGWASVSFIAIGNSTIQLSAEPSMRGRAIALWQVAFQGTTPIGGPAIGWIIAATSPRTGLAVGGASCFVAALGGIALARRSRPSPPPQVTRHEHPSPAGPGTAVPAEDPVW